MTRMNNNNKYKIQSCTAARSCDAKGSLKAILDATDWAVENQYFNEGYKGSIVTDTNGGWHCCISYYQENDFVESFPACPDKWCGK
ncbi:unnamed protein product [Candida verbasci]|uniref:Uncharacterized protein n=1 Tax=Candida verbasci TaxID=1227364 RepID=A0A9W4U252_9ASCO|nr:unnamed protein product [Candida verbasci]